MSREKFSTIDGLILCAVVFLFFITLARYLDEAERQEYPGQAEAYAEMDGELTP